jgi:hypothetical protein
VIILSSGANIFEVYFTSMGNVRERCDNFENIEQMFDSIITLKGVIIFSIFVRHKIFTKGSETA